MGIAVPVSGGFSLDVPLCFSGLLRRSRCSPGTPGFSLTPCRISVGPMDSGHSLDHRARGLGVTEPMFCVTAPAETVPLSWPVGTARGWVSVRLEIHLGLQHRFVQRMWLEYTGWTWGCMGRSVGHFSHVKLPFLGSFTPCLMTVTKQSTGTLLLPLGSLGVPSAQVSSVFTIRGSPCARKWSGKREEHQHSPGV